MATLNRLCLLAMRQLEARSYDLRREGGVAPRVCAACTHGILEGSHHLHMVDDAEATSPGTGMCQVRRMFANLRQRRACGQPWGQRGKRKLCLRVSWPFCLVSVLN